MAGAGMVLGLGIVAAAVGGYVLLTREPEKKAATTTPGTGTLDQATCLTLFANLPKASPTVAEGALRVGTQTATSIPPGTAPDVARKKVADAMADYLDAQNYPNLATCLRQNPQILDTMKAIPIPSAPPIPTMTDADCEKTMSKLPSDVATKIHDLAAAIPPAQIATAAEQAAKLLDGLGYHEAAACVRRSPTILLGASAPPTVEGCTAEVKALPPAILAEIAASNPKTAEDVAHVLETRGYQRAADCVRSYPTLLSSVTFGVPGGIPSTIPGLPTGLPLPPATFFPVGP